MIVSCEYYVLENRFADRLRDQRGVVTVVNKFFAALSDDASVCAPILTAGSTVSLSACVCGWVSTQWPENWQQKTTFDKSKLTQKRKHSSCQQPLQHHNRHFEMQKICLNLGNLDIFLCYKRRSSWTFFQLTLHCFLWDS